MRNSFKGAATAAPFFPTLLDQMPNAIMVFEAESQQLVYVNPAAESALDLSRKSLEGQSVHDLFGGNEALNRMIAEVKLGHVVAQRQELVLHSLPGSIHQELIQGTICGLQWWHIRCACILCVAFFSTFVFCFGLALLCRINHAGAGIKFLQTLECFTALFHLTDDLVHLI